MMAVEPAFGIECWPGDAADLDRHRHPIAVPTDPAHGVMLCANPGGIMGPMRRTVFFVSDGTGITTETLGHSLLTQFSGLEYRQLTLPFVDGLKTAEAALSLINRTAEEDGVRPIVFASLTAPELVDLLASANALVLDIFGGFLRSLETELGSRAEHAKGRSHGLVDKASYDVRIAALNFALSHDDGTNVERYRQADVVLLGVSRTGKTPTCIYLAMQFGVRAANYPLTEEDLASNRLPRALDPVRAHLYGLSIDAERLHRIRSERRPHSVYASMRQCHKETHDAEALYRRERLRWLDVTAVSIEEIASRILQDLGLSRRMY
jgi:regulator of PEP synthase PpsR (kinase-PPPase family)